MLSTSTSCLYFGCYDIKLIPPGRPEKPLDWIGKFLLARSGVVETRISDEDAEGEPDDEWLSGGGDDQAYGTQFEAGMGSYAMQSEMGQ